jgi:hypothetical protein
LLADEVTDRGAAAACLLSWSVDHNPIVLARR